MALGVGTPWALSLIDPKSNRHRRLIHERGGRPEEKGDPSPSATGPPNRLSHPCTVICPGDITMIAPGGTPSVIPDSEAT